MLFTHVCDGRNRQIGTFSALVSVQCAAHLFGWEHKERPVNRIIGRKRTDGKIMCHEGLLIWVLVVQWIKTRNAKLQGTANSGRVVRPSYSNPELSKRDSSSYSDLEHISLQTRCDSKLLNFRKLRISDSCTLHKSSELKSRDESSKSGFFGSIIIIKFKRFCLGGQYVHQKSENSRGRWKKRDCDEKDLGEVEVAQRDPAEPTFGRGKRANFRVTFSREFRTKKVSFLWQAKKWMLLFLFFWPCSGNELLRTGRSG